MAKYEILIALFLALLSSCSPNSPSSPHTKSPSNTNITKQPQKPEKPQELDKPELRPKLSKVELEDYLTNIIGIPESELIKAFNDPESPVPARLAAPDDDGFFRIKNALDGQYYKAGRFEFDTTVAKLIEESEKLSKPGLGTFNIIDGSLEPGLVKEVNVAWLQAQRQNRLAVFQVASNQNGLEQASKNTSVEMQSLSAYPFDPTQGPAASIGAAPGILVRWGYAYFDPNTKPNTWRQRDNHQINFLKNLSALPVNQAGYVIWDATPTTLPEVDDFKKIIIGYHENIQVTYGPKQEDKYPVVDDKEQIIDQVFCAAISLGYQNQSKVDVKSPAAIAWSKTVLKGIYEGSLRYARLKNRNKIFLTAVGGGVFQNDPDWIATSIVDLKDFIMASGLQVYFVHYNNILAASLQQLVQDTKGCYKQYNSKGAIIKSLGNCP